VVLLIPLGASVGCYERLPVSIDAPHIEDEILVGLPESGDLSGLIASYDLVEIDRIDGIRVARLNVGANEDAAEALTRMQDDPRIRFAEPNYIVHATAVPNDPAWHRQWNMRAIGVDLAWDLGTGEGIVVAVLDTGVRVGGPDGFDHLLPGYDFVYDDSNPSDFNGHGTHVAGTIAQATNNGVGVAGIAHGASILPVKVLGDYGSGSMWGIAQGITYATDHGADVINMSLGSYGGSWSVEEACDDAVARGTVLVAASGNDNGGAINWPAAYDSVISVAATDAVGDISYFSNQGSGMDIAAPGGDVYEDLDNDGYSDGIYQETWSNGFYYGSWQGTSMASPHVAGAAALVMGQGVTDPAEVRRILTVTARDAGAQGHDRWFGHGRLDVDAAVRMAAGMEIPDDPEPGDDDDEPGDATAPVISGVVLASADGRFSIDWTTDEPSTSGIRFSEWGLYPEEALVTQHHRDWEGTVGYEYTFTIESVDAAGNLASSGPLSVLVVDGDGGGEVDDGAEITGVSWTSTDHDFEIFWSTDAPTQCWIELEIWGTFPRNTSWYTSYTREFWGTAGETYVAWIHCEDGSGEETVHGSFEIYMDP
jgi:subtilisin family serine protease